MLGGGRDRPCAARQDLRSTAGVGNPALHREYCDLAHGENGDHRQNGRPGPQRDDCGTGHDASFDGCWASGL